MISRKIVDGKLCLDWHLELGGMSGDDALLETLMADFRELAESGAVFFSEFYYTLLQFLESVDEVVVSPDCSFIIPMANFRKLENSYKVGSGKPFTDDMYSLGGFFLGMLKANPVLAEIMKLAVLSLIKTDGSSEDIRSYIEYLTSGDDPETEASSSGGGIPLQISIKIPNGPRS